MGKYKNMVAQLLFILSITLTSYCFSQDNLKNTSYLENYFFHSEQNNHYFAFSKNQYFEITPGSLKIWIWNPIKNAFCEPVEICFLNNESNAVLGSEKSDVTYSYYSGNNPDNWIHNNFAYKKLCIPNIYKGIDLEFYFNNHELEFDFIINSQTDTNQILWRICGNNVESHIENNQLVITNNEGYTYTFSIPEIYKSAIKNPASILSHNVSFLDLDGNTYQIYVDIHDRNSELLIDPILTLSTYIIFPSSNWPSSLFTKMCLDYYNNIEDIALIGGAIEFPGSSGTDVSGFLCKLSPQLGKTHHIVFINGMGEDYINFVTHFINMMNEFIVIGGKTNSLNFPTVNPVQPLNSILNRNGTSGEFDGFLMMFDKDLRITFSTFVGGSGYDSIEDININTNNLFFAGNTNSTDLPLVNSSLKTQKGLLADGFWGILKLTDPLECRYITKLGIDGIEIKDIESYSTIIYLCGNTSVGLPYFNPIVPETPVQGQDIFIQTYSYSEGTTIPDISLLSSLFLGGSDNDILEKSILLNTNTLCLAGNTYSNDLPEPVISTIPEKIPEKTYPFLILVNPTVTQKLIGTHYIFGNGTDIITDIKTPSTDSSTFFIVGYTNSYFENFNWNNTEFTSNPFDTSLNNGANENFDAMVWRLQWNSTENTITPTWGTFLGGTLNDTALSIGTVDSNHICFSGITNSPDFPLQGRQTIAPAYLPSHYLSAFNISGKVIYVNPDSSVDPTDGSSWEKGYHTISEAISSANNYDEIWIKSGYYNERLTINGFSNLILRGGFSGLETNIDEINPWENPTKISPIQVKGTGNLGTPTLNITSCMNIVLNGLVFESGTNILGDGGAINISNSTVRILCSQFYKNNSNGNGGAIYINNSYANIANCVFVQNSCSGNGSGISANESTVKIIHCTFANNFNSVSEDVSTVDIQGSTSMLMILNSIIWANEGNTHVQINYPEIIPPVNLLFSHSIIQNFSLLSTPPSPNTVLDTNPLFIENPSETTPGDLNLNLESPAVNLADPISLTIEYGAVNEDIRRKPRIFMGESCKPDAGAFEIFPAPPPVITLLGDNPLYLTINNPYIEPGYVSKDGCDVDITFLVDVTSNVNTEQTGEYTVEYSVISPYDQGQIIKAIRRVIVITASSQIILTGPSDVVIECGNFFIDPGAVAFDLLGNNISNEIIVTDNVDYSTPGTYTIEYSVTETESHPALHAVRNITVQDTTPPILILIGPPQITIPCGSTWSDPGYIAFDRCSLNNVQVNVTGSVNTSATGTYTITYTAYDENEHTSTLTRKVVVDCNIPQLQQCQNQCSNDTSPVDNDGDGLSFCIETCLGTSDQDIDSDDDSMPDYFEATYNLNPLFNDAKEDADLDGLSNLEEFLTKTNPIDSNSPWEAHYVSNSGDDDNPGTLQSPRATITTTLGNINTNQNKQSSIVLFPGNYYEDIVLSENIVLIGITAYGENNRPVIYGKITGANGAKIYNVDIKSSTTSPAIIPVKAEVEKPILLNCGNTSMHIRNVRFLGTGSEIGISVEGGNCYNTIIERCLFQDLSIGILIGDSIPVIRRCIFKSSLSTKTDSTGIYIEDNSGSYNPSNSLGDVNDPNTGWNTFNLNGGKAIVCKRAEEIKAHNNDWGTEDSGEILNQVEGNLDTQYYLGKGKAMIASSLACVVWNANNRDPIINATVAINPSVYPPLTQNTKGVYTFSSIPSGTYTITISAPNFLTRQINTNIPEGDLKSESVALKPVEGEGTADGEGTTEGIQEGSTEGTTEGEKEILIPDVRGMSVEEATQVLNSAGLRVSNTIKEEYNQEVSRGKVTRTEPAIGTKVVQNTEITLVVSKGAKRRFIISCGPNYNRNSYWGDIIICIFASTLLLYNRPGKVSINKNK
ncbi:MAG: immunoglobulin-like domain-containing protein [Candidatus Hydrogenedens sp.]